ncbi:MAG TPA: hypothetical protein VEC12_05370 [Bacteroidia bacterium]|nr:hypothetical protein [Bacteroidia bacterium]
MKLYIIATLCVALGAFNPASQPDNDPKADFKVFIREAVKSGLDENNVPESVVSRLIDNNKLWVAKCPICDNVKAGLKSRLNHERNQDTTNVVLSPGELANLSSPNDSVAKAALKDLVDVFVQRYYAELGMTEAEIAAMEEQLLGGRKQGMGLAGGDEDFYCASCDGACHKPDKE